VADAIVAWNALPRVKRVKRGAEARAKHQGEVMDAMRRLVSAANAWGVYKARGDIDPNDPHDPPWLAAFAAETAAYAALFALLGLRDGADDEEEASE